MNPHKNNKDDAKKFEVLQDEVMHFQQKGQIIFTGDLNARTWKKEDYILADKHNFLDEDEDEEDSKFLKRNSEDQKTDNRGEELLELCKSLNLVILNDRKSGDIQPNGCSVVNYVVSDYEASNNIPSLKIGKYSPWLSDQCALHFELSSEEVAIDRNSSTKEKVPIQYIWG